MPRKRKETTDRWHDPFPSRLRELLVEEEISHQTLATFLGVARQSIGAYCDGSAFPSLENLTKIAKYFSVSTDYLLGLSEIRSTENNLKIACDTTGLSEDAVVAICGINASASSLMPYLNKLLAPHHGADFSKILADISLYISSINFESDFLFDAMCIACKDELEKHGFIVTDPKFIARNKFEDITEDLKKMIKEIASSTKQEAQTKLDHAVDCVKNANSDEKTLKRILLSAIDTVCVKPEKKAVQTLFYMLDQIAKKDQTLIEPVEHTKQMLSEAVSERTANLRI